uniref:Uncharacterized protein n=1 Tax=Solanum lycopersicum TaxID=4081 RepID=A0A3Q7G8J4_SOLLC
MFRLTSGVSRFSYLCVLMLSFMLYCGYSMSILHNEIINMCCVAKIHGCSFLFLL